MASSFPSNFDLLDQVMGDENLVKRIRQSKVLLVGAGGIGCEVLKGLLLSGFESITIIDLDTIDVSNLNRQFLYNQSHVGKSKAQVSAEVAVELFSHRHPTTGDPISKVEPIHDSILNMARFNCLFYTKFTFVINALDNNSTRTHVNRMCIATNVPLIESGSAGYYGNTRLIMKGITECFECVPPKKDEQLYASCTIRTTPTRPIHCIVFGKHLFNQLFGAVLDEDISPDINPEDIHGEDKIDKSQLKKQTTREFVEEIGYDPKLLFAKLFKTDIEYLMTMEHLWQDRRKAPRSISYDLIESDELDFDKMDANQECNATAKNCIERDQQFWTMKQCLAKFCDSIKELYTRFKDSDGLEWDKDDDVALDFATAVSNFRSHCFYIERKSRFEVKQLAGNIKPAIASTNTIVGGYIILQAMKLLASLMPQRFEKQPTEVSDADRAAEAERIRKNNFAVYISNIVRHGLSPNYIEQLPPPIPTCWVCSSNVQDVIITLPLATTTLGAFVDVLLKNRLNCIAPDVALWKGTKTLWLSEDELEEEEEYLANLKARTLSSFSFLTDGVKLVVNDNQFKLYLIIQDKAVDPEENDGDFFKIVNMVETSATKVDEPKEAAEAAAVVEAPKNGEAKANGVAANNDNLIEDVDEEELVFYEEESSSEVSKTGKREHSSLIDNGDETKLQELDDHELKAKRARPE